MQTFGFCVQCLLLLTWQVGRPLAKTEILNLDNNLYRLVRAEGDPTTEDPLGTGPPSPTTQQQRNGTTAAYCQRNNCCAMYTWPGNELYQNNPENEVPTSCDSLPAIQGDRGHSIACFDPIIYSNSTLGARPGPEIAIDECTAKDYPCFCSTGAEGVCIKLSFIRNTATKMLVNETRFCGTLTNVESGDIVTSGCYEERLSGTGYSRQVCACEATVGDYCNRSPSSTLLSSTLLSVPFLIGLFH